MLAVHTLEETAAALGLSVDVVRLIEIKALKKLRNDPVLRSSAKAVGLLRTRTDDEKERMK